MKEKTNTKKRSAELGIRIPWPESCRPERPMQIVGNGIRISTRGATKSEKNGFRSYLPDLQGFGWL